MEHTAPPSWAEGDPQILAEQFVKITGDSIREYPTKFFALVTATAAASLHNVLVTSPAHSRQQQIENIQATAAAVVQAFRAKPSRGQNAGTQGTPAPLKNLNKVFQRLQQQLQQQQDPHLVTAAFEVRWTVIRWHVHCRHPLDMCGGHLCCFFRIGVEKDCTLSCWVIKKGLKAVRCQMCCAGLCLAMSPTAATTFVGQQVQEAGSQLVANESSAEGLTSSRSLAVSDSYNLGLLIPHRRRHAS
jgi:hypothetical protein